MMWSTHLILWWKLIYIIVPFQKMRFTFAIHFYRKKLQNTLHSFKEGAPTSLCRRTRYQSHKKGNNFLLQELIHLGFPDSVPNNVAACRSVIWAFWKPPSTISATLTAIFLSICIYVAVQCTKSSEIIPSTISGNLRG